MKLAELLRGRDIDLGMVLAMRHRPQVPRFRRILPLLAAEHPELYNAYQQTQKPREEKMLLRAGYLASFIGHEPGKALFVGLYRNGKSTALSLDEYWKRNPSKELSKLGSRGWHADDGRDYITCFELELTDFYEEWSGRLVINWPGGERSWARWCDKNELKFTVDHIRETSNFDRDMPDWDELVFGWDELKVLPEKWRITLSQWRGVYFIFDPSDGQGYVGSAYGDENIMGRWLNYAASGHGGNRELRQRDPSSFEFSILQRVSPDMEPSDVIRIETKWKDRLHTRDFGMNRN